MCSCKECMFCCFWVEWSIDVSFPSPLLLVYILLFRHSSRVQLFATPRTAAHQAFLSFTIPVSLLKIMSIESVMPSSHLILCRPLLLLPSILPSISLSNEYSGIISFKINWFDLLAVQGTLKGLDRKSTRLNSSHAR